MNLGNHFFDGAKQRLRRATPHDRHSTTGEYRHRCQFLFIERLLLIKHKANAILILREEALADLLQELGLARALRTINLRDAPAPESSALSTSPTEDRIQQAQARRIEVLGRIKAVYGLSLAENVAVSRVIVMLVQYATERVLRRSCRGFRLGHYSAVGSGSSSCS